MCVKELLCNEISKGSKMNGLLCCQSYCKGWTNSHTHFQQSKGLHAHKSFMWMHNCFFKVWISDIRPQWFYRDYGSHFIARVKMVVIIVWLGKEDLSDDLIHILFSVRNSPIGFFPLTWKHALYTSHRTCPSGCWGESLSTFCLYPKFYYLLCQHLAV